jgi:GNAT superfamily N-acetyltransferase
VAVTTSAAAPYRIELTDTPDPSMRDLLADALLNYNEAMLGRSDLRPLALPIRSADDGRIVGGLWGRTSFRWLYVELLFVPEALRGRHIGTELLRLAEAEARNRGCLGSWLDTFSSKAHRFYETQGYTLFGEISDYPPGNSRRSLLKRFGN